MTLKLAIVVQPSKIILEEAIKFANKYTRKNYNKTSNYIRYVYLNNTVFRVPHITLRESSLVKTSEIPEFLNKIKEVAKNSKQFRVTLNSTHSFVNGGRITTYYWHVKQNSALKSVYKKICKTLNKRWPPQHHYANYTPHLTLIVDETNKSPLPKSKPASMPKRICTIDKITILYRPLKTKPIVSDINF